MAGRAKSLPRLLAKLPDLQQVLRGSLVTRYRSCGKAGCHCARENDPGHGPAYYLMVTVAPGKTTSIYVAKRKLKQVQVYLQNFRCAREILEAVSNENRAQLKKGTLFKGG